MPTTLLGRLLFEQGGICFFCKQQLAVADASVEHLHAKANGGSNGEDNCVACCKALNSLLGRKSLKAKFEVVLNQKGVFKCPNDNGKSKAPVAADDNLQRLLTDLKKRGTARPGTLKTLASSVSVLFQKKLSGPEVNALIDQLKARGIISLVGSKVRYKLSQTIT